MYLLLGDKTSTLSLSSACVVVGKGVEKAHYRTTNVALLLICGTSRCKPARNQYGRELSDVSSHLVAPTQFAIIERRF